jgi:hypothetical protein
VAAGGGKGKKDGKHSQHGREGQDQGKGKGKAAAPVKRVSMSEFAA